jgi:hypothetical protein
VDERRGGELVEIGIEVGRVVGTGNEGEAKARVETWTNTGWSGSRDGSR